jgi:hypothetical protein
VDGRPRPPPTSPSALPPVRLTPSRRDRLRPRYSGGTNAVIVKVGVGGKVCIFTDQGTNLIVGANGAITN